MSQFINSHSVSNKGRYRAARAAKNCEKLVEVRSQLCAALRTHNCVRQCALTNVRGNVRSQMCAAMCAHKCARHCEL